MKTVGSKCRTSDIGLLALATMTLGQVDRQGRVALVVDCSGHGGAVLDGCKIAQRLGKVVLVGVLWRKLSAYSAHDIMHAMFFNYVTLRSGWE